MAFRRGARQRPDRCLQSPAVTGRSQQEIWATVKETQDRLARSVGAPVAAPASPSSLQLSLESEKLKQAQAAYIGALQGAGESGDDIVGYVFAINGKINGGDVYASNALFRKMWRKLLAANVTEAISEKDAARSRAAVGQGRRSLPRRGGNRSRIRTRSSTPASGLRPATAITSLYAETRRADGSWVHRNYLAK